MCWFVIFQMKNEFKKQIIPIFINCAKTFNLSIFMSSIANIADKFRLNYVIIIGC